MRNLTAVLLIALALAACAPTDPSPATLDDDGLVTVQWVKVNPPPGYDGTHCWAYFSSKSISAEKGYGYSGVYCP